MSTIDGGGTPIQSILNDYPQPQQQQIYIPQPQQQMYIPQQQQQQQMYIPQNENYLKSVLKKNKEHLKNEETTAEKFKNITGTAWYKFLVVVLLFIIFGNSWIYDCEKNFTPIGFRIGNPPLMLVVVNGIIVGIIYLIICKLIPE